MLVYERKKCFLTMGQKCSQFLREYVRFICIIRLVNGFKNGFESTVILTLGCCSTKAFITGAVIATSPIAESLITNKCLCLLKIKLIILIDSSKVHNSFSTKNL